MKNNVKIQDDTQSLQSCVSDSAFLEGENIIAFDNESWNKAGKDIGDNSCFYKEAKIIKIYFHIPKLYGSSDWCANIQFNDGRISNGHFLSGLRHYH